MQNKYRKNKPSGFGRGSEEEAAKRAKEQQLEEFRKRQRASAPKHGPGRNQVVEKPKDFRGSFGKLLRYMGRYKAAVFAVMIFAAASTVFNVFGPKIMGSRGLAGSISERSDGFCSGHSAFIWHQLSSVWSRAGS